MSVQSAVKPSLTIKRRLKVPPAKVFAAWTDAEKIKRWMGPGGFTVPQAESDARVGGRYRIVMHRPDGSEVVAGGEFQVLDEPSRIAFTWKWEHGQDTTLVTIFLRDVGGKTEMHFRHEGFTSEEDRNNHNRGWTGSFDRLDEHLKRNPKPPKP